MRESSGAAGRIVILSVLFFLLPMFFAALYFAGNLYSAAEIVEPYNLSIFFGAAAYVLFMGQFLLSSRMRFLERFIPQDRLISVHSVSGMIIAGFILIHFVLKWILVFGYTGPTLQVVLGVAALVLYAVLAPMAVFFLRGKSVKGNKSPPYEKTKTLHNFFALAGLFVVAHVLFSSSTWSAALRIFTAVWGVLCLGAYVHHKILRPQKRVNLTLEEIAVLTPNIHRYRFGGVLPPILQKRRPGQFGYWSFIINRGKNSDCARRIGPEEHPFTFSTPPGESLEITVRSDGDFTQSLPALPLGTAVLLDGPYGSFRPRGLPEGTPLLFLAGGIGITPVLSVIADTETRRKYPMALLWSVRDKADESAGRGLAEFAENDQIFVRTIRTRESVPEGASRHIDATLVREALDFLGIGKGLHAYPAVFLCGPSAFSQSMRRIIREIGIPRRRITEERFSR